MILPSVNGALFQLTWMGLLCPCLSKDEDLNALQALQQLNAAGKRIIWYSRDAGNSSNSAQKLWNVAAGASSVIGGLFGKNKSTATGATAAAGGGGLDSSLHQKDGAVDAAFVVRDNPETGKPELYIDPLPKPSGQTVGYRLQILLRRVDSITNDPTSGKITLLAKPPPTKVPSSAQQQQKPGKVLLVLGLLKDVNVPADAGDQEMFVHNMKVMINWERQRRAAITAAAGHDDDDIKDEEEEQGNFLTKKAQKAKHFAQRELELQQTKRDREKRKSQLVGEGGLKYTAIAMANRATDNSLT